MWFYFLVMGTEGFLLGFSVYPPMLTPPDADRAGVGHVGVQIGSNRAVLTLCVSLFVSPCACAKCRVKKSAFTEQRHSENVGAAEGE